MIHTVMGVGISQAVVMRELAVNLYGGLVCL